MAGEIREYSIFSEGSSMEHGCPDEYFYVSEGPDFITFHDSGYLMVETSNDLVSHTGCHDVGVSHVYADSTEEVVYRTVCVQADCSVQTW
jgi:hypothetical protein